MNTGIDTRTSPVDITEDGGHDLFAHYVEKADATRAMVEGTPIMALCGKIWVPSRDPDNYPVCPTCDELYKENYK